MHLNPATFWRELSPSRQRSKRMLVLTVKVELPDEGHVFLVVVERRQDFLEQQNLPRYDRKKKKQPRRATTKVTIVIFKWLSGNCTEITTDRCHVTTLLPPTPSFPPPLSFPLSGILVP